MSRRTASAGFTLIEMMVVMVIIGLLMALVGPRFIRQEEKAKVGAARAQIELLGTALDTFRLDVGRYREAEARVHARRIAFERRVYVCAKVGELDDLLQALLDLAPRQPQDHAVEQNVFSTRQFWMKTRP